MQGYPGKGDGGKGKGKGDGKGKGAGGKNGCQILDCIGEKNDPSRRNAFYCQQSLLGLNRSGRKIIDIKGKRIQVLRRWPCC